MDEAQARRIAERLAAMAADLMKVATDICPVDPHEAQAYEGDVINLSDGKWIRASEAAARAGCSPDTVIRWCDLEGIGEQLAGRWFVHVDRLNAKLKKRRKA